MKNVLTLLIVLSMAFSQILVAQTLQTSHQGPSTPAPSSVAGATVDLTFSQASDLGNGAPAQIFEAVNAPFDSETADDFVVPAGGSRTIVSFTPLMFSTVGLPVWEGPLIMTVYADAGGAPGAVVFQESFFNPIVSDQLFSTNCPPLAPGTYWIGVQVDMDFNGGTFGQSFWDVSSENTAGPGLVSFRNPGDGFGTGCTDWAPIQVCGVGGGVAPGAAFNLELSEEIIEDVAPIPTMGEWGLMVLGIMLLIFGLVAVNQKRSVTQTLA